MGGVGRASDAAGTVSVPNNNDEPEALVPGDGKADDFSVPMRSNKLEEGFGAVDR